jgi:hypothetical protein
MSGVPVKSDRLVSPSRQRLAADVGSGDHSHLWRVLRSKTGRLPSAVGQALA